MKVSDYRRGNKFTTIDEAINWIKEFKPYYKLDLNGHSCGLFIGLQEDLVVLTREITRGFICKAIHIEPKPPADEEDDFGGAPVKKELPMLPDLENIGDAYDKMRVLSTHCYNLYKALTESQAHVERLKHRCYNLECRLDVRDRADG